MKSTGFEGWTDPALTTRTRATREDLFRELDYLVADLHQGDAMLRDQVRRRITRIRALASTLLPKAPTFVCGHAYGDDPGAPRCSIAHTSQAELDAHRVYVHDQPRTEGDN